jgi:hypothetical protein
MTRLSTRPFTSLALHPPKGSVQANDIVTGLGGNPMDKASKSGALMITDKTRMDRASSGGRL